MENKGLSYKEYKQGRRFLVKISPGESLVGRISDLINAEKIQSAVILSAIGSVKNVKLKDIKSGETSKDNVWSVNTDKSYHEEK